MKCIKCGRSIYAHNTKTKDNKTTRLYACRSCHSVYKTEETLLEIEKNNASEPLTKRKIECINCIHKEICGIKDNYKVAFNAVLKLNYNSLAYATSVCTKYFPEVKQEVPTFLKKKMYIPYPNNQYLLVENDTDGYERADILMRLYGYSLTQGYYHYVLPTNSNVELLDNLMVCCGSMWDNELKRENIGDHLLTDYSFYARPTDSCVLVVNPNKKEIYNLRRINDDRIKG